MKCFPHIFILLSILSLSVMAQDVDMIREMLAKTESAIPDNYRDPASVVEMRSSLVKIEAFVQLQGSLGTSWETSLPLINDIAINDTQKAIFFKAAQILSREEYIAFMTAASDQAASRAISKQQFKWALFPSQKHLREMWIEDPPSESLQQLAKNARMILGDDGSQSKFFNDVLSGKVALDNRPPEQPNPSENAAEGQESVPTTAPNSISTKATPQSSPVVTAEPTKSLPWEWIIGVIVLLAVVGGILLKLRRK